MLRGGVKVCPFLLGVFLGPDRTPPPQPPLLTCWYAYLGGLVSGWVGGWVSGWMGWRQPAAPVGGHSALALLGSVPWLSHDAGALHSGGTER